jgi:release factor glutamine methyltransferase
LALSSEAGDHCYFASDISLEAVAVARRNAAAVGLSERVHFFVGDWFSALRPDPIFDLIVSNPPYVARSVLAGLQPEIVDYEPRLALDGDEDGLRSYRAILASAHFHLKSGGILMLEIGHDQREAVQHLAEQAGRYELCGCRRDYGGHDRVVTIKKRCCISS